MALAVARAGKDRAEKRNGGVAARDHFHLFPVQLTRAHPIEHPIIVFARHKFLLLVWGPSSNLANRGPWSSFGCASTMIFMAYTAQGRKRWSPPQSTQTGVAWGPWCLRPALPQFALPWFQKRLWKTAWQLLVQHVIWTADRAGWKIGGNRKLCRRDLFYFGLGQLASTFPDEYPVIIVRH
jgi:hypothetical protein